LYCRRPGILLLLFFFVVIGFGQFDMVLIDQLVEIGALYADARRGAAAKVAFLPKELNSFDMYVAFSKRSKCYDALKDGFAARIKAYVEQGKVKALLENAEKKK